LPGNQVEAALSARTDTQLAQATVELVHSRGPLLQEPLPAAAIDWICALTATALPEGQPIRAFIRFRRTIGGDRGCAFGQRLGRRIGQI
jgi:hypothetical protein